jgi:hypothetical protein
VVSVSKIVTEDISYLEDWANLIRDSALDLRSLALRDNIPSFFSISSSFQQNITKPYLTPLRFLENGVMRGVVVNTSNQAIIAAGIVGDLVDKVLVDAEKKINPRFEYNHQLLRHFGFDLSDENKAFISQQNNVNISVGVQATLSPNKIIHYKPNDLTVDAVWTLLSLKLKQLFGKKITIVGCGNIGFKLALKLVESGADVTIVRRDYKKGLSMAEAINIARPDSCVALANCVRSALEASKLCDVLIGASSGDAPVITWAMIDNMASNGFIVDIGKGNVDKFAVAKALERGIEIMRGDITGALYGFVSHALLTQDVIDNKMGRVEVTSKISILSGGLLGEDGEFIVDNFKCPTIIYGIADGSGNLKIELNDDEQINLRELRRIFKIV